MAPSLFIDVLRALTATVNTIVGAVIAGLVGLGTTIYLINRQQEIREENWRWQLEHLTERLQFDYGVSDQVAHSTTDEQYRDWKTADLVIPELERHLGDAPIRIPDEARNAQRDLISAYTRLPRKEVGDIATVNRLKKISKHAERLETEIEA